MMATYTDVFGNQTLPPAEYGYASFTISTDTTFVWPYNVDGSQYVVAKVMDVSCAPGNAVILPDARDVSSGEDFLVRNVGSNSLIVKDFSGIQIASVAAGSASYFYLTANTTAAGVYGVIGFGTGTSVADAASLAGYGIKAVGASLNQSHPTFPTNSGITLAEDHRAKLVVFTGGTGSFSLTSALILGDDYFTLFRNDGTGTATIDPAGGELIDGMSTMQVQPGESLMLICTGTQWYSVGYGRSVLYQFTQLTKDVSAGGTITLTAAEASNKLVTFIGNPSGSVNVVVPSVVAVYYTQNSVSTPQTVTLKTAAGSGVGIPQGARIIALCDGTNVVSAQSATANTSVSLTDGSASVPSLYFATQTNSGLYKSGTQDVGVTVNGVSVGVFGSTGLYTPTIGPNALQRHVLPAVSSDTVTLNVATQTLSNKTLISPTIGTIINGGTLTLPTSTDTLVGRATTDTLTNKTLTSPVIGTIINGGTLTLPSTTDTLVGRATTDTLTNKTISGANNTLSNIGNASLVNSSVTINGNTVSLGSSAVIPGMNTSALTFGTGLIGGSYNGYTPVTVAIDTTTVATLTDVQTLTNKTLGAGTVDASTTLVSQVDIGTSPNQIPLVQYLGTLAFRETVMVPVPESATAQGVPGDLAQDGSFLYICTAPNAWKRVALSSW